MFGFNAHFLNSFTSLIDKQFHQYNLNQNFYSMHDIKSL